MNPIPLSWTIGGAALLLAALAGTGWLLWGQIERNGRLEAKVEQAEAAVKTANAAVERQKGAMRVQREIYDANDRAVVAAAAFEDQVRTRTVVVVREIMATPGAADAARPPVRLGAERLRELWDRTDDRRREAGAGADRPGADPAAGPARDPAAGGADRR